MSADYSNMTPTEVRLQLLANGYDPIPLRGKRPDMAEGWQWQKIGHADREQVELWAKSWPEAKNSGLLCQRTPFLDIDILDKDAADDCAALVAERFETGVILQRFGKSPKRAIPFCTYAPFPKILIPVRAPNDPEGLNKERIEFLGDGQQCAILGTHPDTRRPYSWYGGDLFGTSRSDLPVISGEEEARALAEDMADLLVTKYGYTREKTRQEKKAERERTFDFNGGADWLDYLKNLIDHDNDVPLAMALLYTGMSDGAAVNFGRALIKLYAPNDDPPRKQRRINEWPSNVSSARAKIGERPEDRPLTTPQIISSKEYVAGFVPPEYLVQGLLTQSFLYALTGMTGSGKTSKTLRLAASVAQGKLFAGRKTKKHRVLYLAAENPLDVLYRWIALSQQMEFDHDTIDVFFITGVFQISQMNGALIKEAERIGGGFGLIIVDTGPAFFEGADANDRVQQQTHARMFRDLIETIPGRPVVIVNCHPVKNAGPDNLIPAGGGTFLNEIDGNLTSAKDGDTSELHWQGKWRGVDFAPMNFLIRTVTHEKLKDSDGNLMPTVVCDHITEAAKESMIKAAKGDRELVLLAIRGNPGISLTDIASKVGFLYDGGEPNKSKAQRLVGDLTKRKLVTRNPATDELELTEAATGYLNR
jgi:hypothetical protein